MLTLTNMYHRCGAFVLPLVLALLALATPLGAQTAADSVHVKQAKDTLAAIVKRSTSPTVDRQARWLAAREDSLAKRRARVDTVRLVRVDTVFVAKGDTTVVVKPDTTPPVVIVTPGPGPSPVLFTHPFGPPANGAVLAALPQDTVSVEYPTIRRRIPVVSMQAALDTARAGDELLCAVGSVHPILRPSATTRAGYAVIRTNVSDAVLGAGRMTKARADSLNLCTITTTNSDAPIWFGSGSGYVRLHGVRVTTTSPLNNALVRVGANESLVSALPHHIVLDRVVADCGPLNDCRRCVALGGTYEAIVRSSMLNCHSRAGDAQGVWTTNAKGPIRIEDNTIQGSHQSVFLGGSDPAIVGQVPSDVVIRRNDLRRPYAWRAAGWQAKTSVELKLGRRVLIEGNVIGGIYPDAQVGYAVLLKTENQDGGPGEWSETSDVTVRYNRIVGAAGAFNMAPLPQGPGVPMSRVTVYGNESDSIGVGVYQAGGAGDALQLLGVADVIFRDNWTRNPSARSCIYSVNPNPRFVATGIVCGGQYGIRGEDGGLAVTMPGAILSGNTVVAWQTAFGSWPASPADAVRAALLAGVVVAP